MIVALAHLPPIGVVLTPPLGKLPLEVALVIAVRRQDEWHCLRGMNCQLQRLCAAEEKVDRHSRGLPIFGIAQKLAKDPPEDTLGHCGIENAPVFLVNRYTIEVDGDFRAGDRHTPDAERLSDQGFCLD